MVCAYDVGDDVSTDLCYRRQGELKRQAGSGVVVEVVLAILNVTLILERTRAAVSGYEGIHLGVNSESVGE